MIFVISSLREDQIQIEELEATHWTGSSVAWTSEQGGYPVSVELYMKYNERGEKLT